MAQRFEDYIGHDISVVDATAKILADAQAALDNGDMTQDEFREIANDIIELHAVTELADDINDKEQFKDIFDAFRSIVTTIAPMV